MKPLKLIVLFFSVHISFIGLSQVRHQALVLTGNGNTSGLKEQYPPWSHEFQNDLVVEILDSIVELEISSDLNILQSNNLEKYDLIISNSIFLEPDSTQLDALYNFVAEGKSFLSLHCGILSFLNWDKYEDFFGGIFIGGPSEEPEHFKVITTNDEFWGYGYSFRNTIEHPVSTVVEDFITKDELYYFQPNTKEFYVIARAENHPVMWWHPLGKGKVMSLTLGHDSIAKSNKGYKQLLQNGVQWLLDNPIIYYKPQKPVSNRFLNYPEFFDVLVLNNSGSTNLMILTDNADLFSVINTNKNNELQLTGKTGKGFVKIVAQDKDGRKSEKKIEVNIVEDGIGNIASYFGNKASCSSNENSSPLFDVNNILDGDPSTRWSSAKSESATVELDLQKSYQISKLKIQWEASYASEYSIEISDNGKDWKPLFVDFQSDGGIDEHTFQPVVTRHIRLNATKRASNKWGYSIYEFEVYK